MPRCNQWPEKLALFIEEKRNQPFDWLENNCGFFACDWVAILLGVDPVAELRTLTARQLTRLVNKKTVAGLVTELSQWPLHASVAWARRGDVVEIDLPEFNIGPALGVCDGARSVFPGTNGIAFVRTADCLRAWRID